MSNIFELLKKSNVKIGDYSEDKFNKDFENLNSSFEDNSLLSGDNCILGTCNKIKNSAIKDCKIIGNGIKIVNSVLKNTIIIGDNILIMNSFIYDNTYISKNNIINNSNISESFIEKANIDNIILSDSEIKDSDVYNVVVKKIYIDSSSLIPTDNLELEPNIIIINDGKIENKKDIYCIGEGKSKATFYKNYYNNILFADKTRGCTFEDYTKDCFENERNDIIPILPSIKSFFTK